MEKLGFAPSEQPCRGDVDHHEDQWVLRGTSTVLIEIQDDLVFYSYDVRGVEYTASQDIGPLKDRMPVEISPHGAVSVKYDPRNPANSIVLAEQWSGLR